MALAQLLQVASLLALCHQGATLDYQLRGRDQVRAGLINSPGLGASNAVTFTEIAMASGQLHTTFGDNQDLLLRYQPQVLNSLRYTPAQAGAPATHVWTGWSVLHRALVTYKAGEEHTLAFTGQFNLNLGKLDTGSPGTEAIDAGILPGALGQLISYTNINLVLSLKHRLNRHIRLASTQTVGLIQYQAVQAIGYFSNMPQLQTNQKLGSQTQYRLFVRLEAEYLLNARASFFADVDLTDVSYQDTASFPAFAPSVGYGSTYAGPGKFRLQAGFIKYWVNPLPGVFERPGYLPTASLTLSQAFTQVGMPKLSANILLGIAPYYNLQFSSLEPRSTLMAQLNYAASRRLTFLGTFRLLSSRFHNLRRWNRLQRGHPRNILLASVGLRYNWLDILETNVSVYGSDQSYEKSSTMPYTKMRQVYMMVGLQGTWQRR